MTINFIEEIKMQLSHIYSCILDLKGLDTHLEYLNRALRIIAIELEFIEQKNELNPQIKFQLGNVISLVTKLDEDKLKIINNVEVDYNRDFVIKYNKLVNAINSLSGVLNFTDLKILETSILVVDNSKNKFN